MAGRGRGRLKDRGGVRTTPSLGRFSLALEGGSPTSKAKEKYPGDEVGVQKENLENLPRKLAGNWENSGVIMKEIPNYLKPGKITLGTRLAFKGKVKEISRPNFLLLTFEKFAN